MEISINEPTVWPEDHQHTVEVQQSRGHLDIPERMGVLVVEIPGHPKNGFHNQRWWLLLRRLLGSSKDISFLILFSMKFVYIFIYYIPYTFLNSSHLRDSEVKIHVFEIKSVK